jgi:hypothetical protein
MELLLDLIKILLPASLVLYAVYLVMRSFIDKEIQQLQTQTNLQLQIKQTELEIKQKDVEIKNKEQVLAIRLQAYERMCLFLERINPIQIIPRLNNPEFSVGFFQALLIREIRNEFSHNLAQQLYMSNEAWNLIVKATEEIIVLINNSTSNLNEEASASELSKQILTNVTEYNIRPTEIALDFLKNEARVFLT